MIAADKSAQHAALLGITLAQVERLRCACPTSTHYDKVINLLTTEQRRSFMISLRQQAEEWIANPQYPSPFTSKQWACL